MKDFNILAKSLIFFRHISSNFTASSLTSCH